MADLTRLSGDLLDSFLDYLRFECNVTPNTVIGYETDLRQFIPFLKEDRGHGIRECTRDDIVAFLDLRMDMGTSVRTRARQLSALRRLYGYLVNEGQMTENPTDLLDPMKMPFLLPTVLTEEEVMRLLQAPDDSTPEGLRDRAMIEFMYATGARVSEVCGLTLAQLQLGERLVLLEGKGRKQRLVPVAARAIDWLDAYIERGRKVLLSAARQSHPDARKVVFVSRLGRGLTRQGIWKLIRKYALQVGVKEDMHPHIMRHCFATHLLLRGADLRIIQVLLGHANISTTEIYTHLDKEQLRTTYDRFHPRA